MIENDKIFKHSRNMSKIKCATHNPKLSVITCTNLKP